MLDRFCARKVHPTTKEVMKFFDRHLSQRQCQQVRGGEMVPSADAARSRRRLRRLLILASPVCLRLFPPCLVFAPSHLQLYALMQHYQNKLHPERDWTRRQASRDHDGWAAGPP